MSIQGIDFLNLLWEKQRAYMDEISNPFYYSRFKAFKDVFNYFEPGQAVTQIACGSIPDDLFLTMDRVGKEGRITLIDGKPDFIFDRVSGIVGAANLPKGKDFYATKEGIRQLQDVLSQANIEAYVQYLPPYPQEVKNKSQNHVMAINAAFELMAHRHGGPPANPVGIITETHRKLKSGGSFIVQGIVGGDVDEFDHFVRRASRKNNLDFAEDKNLKYNPLDGYGAGEWARWIKV